MRQELRDLTAKGKVKVLVPARGKAKVRLYEVDLTKELNRKINVEAASPEEAREKASAIIEESSVEPSRG